MIEKTFFILILVLLYSCGNGNEHLLIARNTSSDQVLGGTYQFLLERNNTFSYSTIPFNPDFSKPQIIKGRYFIKQDTIHFTRNSRFKKAIIKNGELELIGNYFKLQIIENNTGIQPKRSSVYLDDFTFFSNVNGGYFGFEEGKNVDLNQQELNQLKWYIQHKMDLEKGRFKRHTKQSEYFKQCISIQNEKNEKIVWINCISKKNKIVGNRWRCEIQEVNDGGELFFQMKVNLTKGTVYDFYMNGYA